MEKWSQENNRDYKEKSEETNESEKFSNLNSLEQIEFLDRNAQILEKTPLLKDVPEGKILVCATNIYPGGPIESLKIIETQEDMINFMTYMWEENKVYLVDEELLV